MSTRSDDRNSSDIPPAYTIEPVDAPPMNAGSTTAQLKGDIDSGRTGDKNDMLDPGLSPLGTDDEAAGTPPSPERIDLARHEEASTRWQGGAETDSYAHRDSRKALYAFVGFIGLVLVLFVGAVSMF